jgi:hypothetical protein
MRDIAESTSMMKTSGTLSMMKTGGTVLTMQTVDEKKCIVVNKFINL